MVKCKKIKRFDIVKYGGREWFVKKKREHKYLLVRRDVKVGSAIWVARKKVKLADHSWRSELQKNDPVCVFLGGIWCHGSVIRREGNNICVQLSFTNFTMRLPQNSGRLRQDNHEFPLWAEDATQHVLYNSHLRVERAPGILFPMEYAEGTPVRTPQPKYITTVKFPLQQMPSFSMKMYNHLSKEEIMHDIHFSMNPDMPLLLRQIVSQYVNFRRKAYPLGNNLLQTYVEEALFHNDHRRVQELMTVTEKEDIMVRNEWAIREYFSYPFFDVNIRVTTCLEIDLMLNTMFGQPIPAPVKQILLSISKPLPYEPPVYQIDSSPCMQYVISRMLGMEETPLQALHLREVNSFFLTEDEGFCTKTLNRFGGVINVYGLDTVALVRQIMQRSPHKTLVIVDPNSLDAWSGFSLWYGKKKEDDTVVVTTKSTLHRCWSELKSFKRIISLVMPKPNSVFAQILEKHSAKIRWAICKPSNENYGWFMIGQKPDNRARIALSKSQMEHMGVLFPVMSLQRIVCDCDHSSYQQIFKNTFWMPNKKIDEYLSKFLLHPSLVPIHVRGQKLDVCEGTIDVIAKRFHIKLDVLKDRVSETCSVCLEKITTPSVTSCGHVFCETCVKELDSRNINCAMCRAEFSGYMKISDTNTPGIIEMYKGSCYRVPEKETWGLKYQVLKQHTDATFVTKFAAVKLKLRKTFKKTDIVTEKALENGMVVHTKKIVLIEPNITLKHFDKAWSQDLEIIQLSYTVKR